MGSERRWGRESSAMVPLGSDFEDHAVTVDIRAERRGAEDRSGTGHIKSPGRLPPISASDEIIENGFVSRRVHFVHSSCIVCATACSCAIKIAGSISSHWAV